MLQVAGALVVDTDLRGSGFQGGCGCLPPGGLTSAVGYVSVAAAGDGLCAGGGGDGFDEALASVAQSG
jgi:hypothetical protein